MSFWLITASDSAPARGELVSFQEHDPLNPKKLERYQQRLDAAYPLKHMKIFEWCDDRTWLRATREPLGKWNWNLETVNA